MNLNSKELTIELTTKCQLNCAWCSSKYDEECELSFNNVANILRSNKEEYSIVRFSGGEPTLYPHLDDCVSYAKFHGYKVVLLTNGIERYVNSFIDEYNVQWNLGALENILYLKNNNYNVVVNVVNVLEASIVGIGGALDFCLFKDIPIHIMKLQKSGNALKNNLTEVKLSMTGFNGCNVTLKKLILPNGKEIKCASEKSYDKCGLLK